MTRVHNFSAGPAALPEVVLAQAQAEVEARLAEPEVYAAAHKARLQSLLLDKARTARQLEEAEAAWLQAGEALEQAEKALAAAPAS